MKPRLVCPLAFLSSMLFPALTLAQYTPGNNNITLLSQLDEYSVYSNIWGYTDGSGREYALLGADAGLSIIDITDPLNPVEVTLIPGPTAAGTIWREIKSYSHYAYVVSEHTSPGEWSGIQIVDLSGLPATASLVNNYRWPGVDSTNARAHTVSVDDEGFLYIQGGTATLGEGAAQGGIRIFDLSDPENPSPLGVFAPLYVHDTFIRDTLLFASNIFEGGHVDIVSVADRSNPYLITSLIYPNGFSHNSWATDDNQFLVTTDEIVGLTMRVWDIGVLWDADPGNNDQIEMVGEYIGDVSSIPHNVYVLGDYAHVSHYLEGVKVIDMADPADPVEVGYYDTHPGPGGTFDGDWGVYPYLPSGNIIVSDVQTGLYVLRFDSASAGGVEGLVTSSSDGRPVEGVTIHFIEANKTVTTDASGNYELRTSEGDHTLAFSHPHFLDDTASVSIPAGANIMFDISLDSNMVRIAFSPGSFDMILPPDSIGTAELVIENVGVGTMVYGLNDVLGANVSLPTVDPAMLFGFGHYGSPQRRGMAPAIKGENDTIFIDPLDDLIFGDGLDVHIITAAVTGTDITFGFEFADPIDQDSALAVWSIDADFDVGSGAHPGGFGVLLVEQDLGAEFDILIDVPGFFSDPMTANLWVGANEVPTSNPLYSTPLSIVDNVITFTIPLSELDNDDGNMAVAGLFAHVDDFGNATSLDFAPDVGNATVGIDPSTDLPWLSFSSKGGVLQTGEADTVMLTFDAAGYVGGEDLSGLILLTSNDPFNGEVQIPVSLTVEIINSVGGTVPTEFALEQNFPNPFNPATKIRFSLPSASDVRLDLYNLLGERVAALLDDSLPAGEQTIQWNAQSFASGIYFYRLQAGTTTITRRLVVLR